jgi:hypothetical protein
LVIDNQIEIPKSYVKLSNSLNILKETQQKEFITKNELFIHMNEQSIIMEEIELESALTTLHNLGHILYYPILNNTNNDGHENLYLILNPQWLIDVFKSVITFKDTPGIKGGWLYYISLSLIWPKFDESIHQFLLEILHTFNIAIPCKDKSLIPCRIENLLPQSTFDLFNKLLQRRIEFPTILPIDLFPTLIANPKLFPLFLDLESNIWKDSIRLSSSLDTNHHVLIKCVENQINIYSSSIQENINIIGEFTLLLKTTIQHKYPG